MFWRFVVAVLGFEGEGFFDLAVLGEVAAGEDFIAVADGAGFGFGIQVDLADVEFGEGLEFARGGLAIMIGVDPNFYVIKAGVLVVEAVVVVAVLGFEGGKAVAVGFGAGIAVAAGEAAKVFGEGFADGVDFAVVVFVEDEDAVLGADPAGLF